MKPKKCKHYYANGLCDVLNGLEYSPTRCRFKNEKITMCEFLICGDKKCMEDEVFEIEMRKQ